jgi:hypothetical protein
MPILSFFITNLTYILDMYAPLKVLKFSNIVPGFITNPGTGNNLLYSHAFCEISGLVHVQPAQSGDVIRQ